MVSNLPPQVQRASRQELPVVGHSWKRLWAVEILMVKRDKAYEIWKSFDGTWTWYVLKKWQKDDNKPNARWFCDVVTPICPNGEMGDVYVSEIKSQAKKVK